MVQKNDPSVKTPFDGTSAITAGASVAEAGPAAEINSSFTAGVDGETRHFTLHRVMKQKDLDNVWIPQLHTYFTDETDWESKTQLRGRLRDKARNLFLTVADDQGGPAGMMLLQTDPAIKGGSYIPWAGIAEQYRNARLFPMMLDEIKSQMVPRGLQYVAFEVEDPSRIHVAYDEQPGGPAAKMAAGRVNFYRRETKALIINDPEIPFVRPASDNDRNIQAYDLMALKILDPNCEKFKGRVQFDAEGKPASISKDLYREVYIEMIQQQYGMLPEAQLRKDLPAVDQFLKVCDASPKTTVNLQTGVINARSLTRFPTNLQWAVPGMAPPLQPAQEPVAEPT